MFDDLDERAMLIAVGVDVAELDRLTEEERALDARDSTPEERAAFEEVMRTAYLDATAKIFRASVQTAASITRKLDSMERCLTGPEGSLAEAKATPGSNGSDPRA
jgi:hypothetical protein